jgi:hypothetical protein
VTDSDHCRGPGPDHRRSLPVSQASSFNLSPKEPRSEASREGQRGRGRSEGRPAAGFRSYGQSLREEQLRNLRSSERPRRRSSCLSGRALQPGVNSESEMGQGWSRLRSGGGFSTVTAAARRGSRSASVAAAGKASVRLVYTGPGWLGAGAVRPPAGAAAQWPSSWPGGEPGPAGPRPQVTVTVTRTVTGPPSRWQSRLSERS